MERLCIYIYVCVEKKEKRFRFQFVFSDLLRRIILLVLGLNTRSTCNVYFNSIVKYMNDMKYGQHFEADRLLLIVNLNSHNVHINAYASIDMDIMNATVISVN